LERHKFEIDYVYDWNIKSANLPEEVSKDLICKQDKKGF